MDRLRRDRSRRLSHATGRTRQAVVEHPVLELQRLAGNQAVGALLVQRDEDDDEFDEEVVPEPTVSVETETAEGEAGENEPAGAEVGEIADAATEDLAGEADTPEPAEKESDADSDLVGDDGPSLEELDAAFDPGSVLATMAAQGVGDFPTGPTDVAQAIRVQRDPEPAQAEPAKQASAGDLLEALSKVAEVKEAIERLKALVARSWEDIKKGTTTPEKVVLFTTGGLILGGAAAGGLSNPSSRALVFKSLDGVKIPIPGVDGLSITPKLNERGLTGGTVDVDLLKLVPGLRKVPGLD